MDLQDLLSHLAVALGIGLLIGLERGWTMRGQAAGHRTAGIRTFTLTGLLGGVMGATALALGGAATPAGAILLGIAFASCALVIAAFHIEENRAEKTFSATSAIAAIMTFALGAFAVVGDMRAAAAAAVATAGLLASRTEMHGWLKRINERELQSALILLAMTFIVLPVLPGDAIGPFGGVNLRETWLIAIVLAGVSFFGYVAMKYLGTQHGMLVAGLVGGLTSSTAVTAANAQRAAAGEGSPQLLAGGVALATAVSFGRVIAIVLVLSPGLLRLIAPPLAAAIVVAVGFALVSMYWRDQKTGRNKPVKFRNPFEFWTVVGFAAFLAVVIVLGRLLGETLGANGVIAGAAALGLADIDSVTVSMTRLVPAPLGPKDAAFAILAAVVTNNVSKVAIGALVGRGRFALEIGIMAALCVLAGGAVFWLALSFYPA